jgi:hypothetical protein
MSVGAAVMLAVLAALLGGFVLFFLYSRTPAWRQGDTRMALMQVLIVVGPMFGMRFDKPPPDRPAVMGPGPDPDGPAPDDPRAPRS